MGTAKVTTPIGDVKFYIVDTDTPFLICLKDMDALNAFLQALQSQMAKRGELTNLGSSDLNFLSPDVLFAIDASSFRQIYHA